MTARGNVCSTLRRLDNYFMSPQVRIQTDSLDFNLRYAQFRADEGHFDQLFFTQPDTSEETWIGPMGVEAGFNTHYLYETPAPSAVLSGPARHTDQIGEVKRKAVDHNRRNDRSIERDVINVEASLPLGITGPDLFRRLVLIRIRKFRLGF